MLPFGAVPGQSGFSFGGILQNVWKPTGQGLANVHSCMQLASSSFGWMSNSMSFSMFLYRWCGCASCHGPRVLCHLQDLHTTVGVFIYPSPFSEVASARVLPRCWWTAQSSLLGPVSILDAMEMRRRARLRCTCSDKSQMFLCSRCRKKYHYRCCSSIKLKRVLKICCNTAG